jgi:hypothetical protein
MLRDLAGLAEPTGKAVDAIRAACAAATAPWRIRREAKAHADAAIIKAESDAAAQAILQRAEHRRQDEEMRRQHNLEQIMARTEKLLPAELPQKKADPDWVFHFLNEAQDTGNKELQELWARLLAGELASPGTYSRRTVSFIKLLEPAEARAFASFCQILTNEGRAIFDPESQFPRGSLGLDFETIQHLDSIGLIRVVDGGMQYVTEVAVGRDATGKPRSFTWTWGYHDQSIEIGLSPQGSGETLTLSTGTAALTKQGAELAKLVERTPDKRVLENMVESLKKFNPTAVVTVAPIASERPGP